MNYKEEIVANKDSFDGCDGLEDVNSFDKRVGFENRLKQKLVMQVCRKFSGEKTLLTRDKDNEASWCVSASPVWIFSKD